MTRIPSQPPRKLSRIGGWRALAVLAMAGGGCGLLGNDSTAVDGTYQFENEFGYRETIVIRPDYEKDERFVVTGFVRIEETDGVLSGSGSCTRTSLEVVQPGGLERLTEDTQELTFSARRKKSSILDVRISGCAFPKPMEGRLDGGRIILMTDLGFPVSRGTTLISDRFGDPTRLVMTRTQGG